MVRMYRLEKAYDYVSWETLVDKFDPRVLERISNIRFPYQLAQLDFSATSDDYSINPFYCLFIFLFYVLVLKLCSVLIVKALNGDMLI